MSFQTDREALSRSRSSNNEEIESISKESIKQRIDRLEERIKTAEIQSTVFGQVNEIKKEVQSLPRIVPSPS